jgi:hypothetical protein
VLVALRLLSIYTFWHLELPAIFATVCGRNPGIFSQSLVLVKSPATDLGLRFRVFPPDQLADVRLLLAGSLIPSLIVD